MLIMCLKAAVAAVRLSYIATAGMETDEQVAAGSAGKEGAETSTSQPAGAHSIAMAPPSRQCTCCSLRPAACTFA